MKSKMSWKILSFKYLDYKKYEEIKGLVKQRESDRNGQVQGNVSGYDPNFTRV